MIQKAGRIFAMVGLVAFISAFLPNQASFGQECRPCNGGGYCCR
jgi:hypothetical protein